MREVKIEKCPYCGGEELIETIATSYGGVFLTVEKVGLGGALVYAMVCRDCGSVVRTFCKEPEKIFRKKDRRSDG